MFIIHVIISVEGNPFTTKNQSLQCLQSIYFRYRAGIFSFNENV